MSFRWNRGMQLLGAVAVLGAAVTGAACGGGGNSGGYSADAGPVSSGGAIAVPSAAGMRGNRPPMVACARRPDHVVVGATRWISNPAEFNVLTCK